MVEDFIKMFYDTTLDERVQQVEERWCEQAREAIDEQAPELATRRVEVTQRLQEIQVEVEDLLEQVRIDPEEFELPAVPGIPEPEVDEGTQPMGLCDSSWDFTEQRLRLIASKRYEIDD